MDPKKRKNISKGMNVGITQRGDRTGKNIIKGKVDEILTKAEEHPYGIMVKLSNGTIGRVKEITTSSSSEEKPTVSEKIEDLINTGECKNIEYKSSALWSQDYSKEQIDESQSPLVKRYGKQASKIILAKTISAFLNSAGGNLIIGIKENKDHRADEVIGVEDEFKKLKNKDYCEEGYRRMILDEVIKPYFPSMIFNHLNDYLEIHFEKIKDKKVCRISVNKGEKKVFLKISGKDLFFIRVDSETREIKGEQIVDYCEKRFK